MHAALAGIVACFVTYFELDRQFYVPEVADKKRLLRALWWAFVVANGLLAAALYGVFTDAHGLEDVNPWVKGALVGVGYLGLARLKFATVQYGEEEVPFGFEFFYESAKHSVYKRINRIAQRARTREALAYANAHTLAQLVTEAKLQVTQDQLLNDDDKKRLKGWILALANKGGDDLDDRAALADYIKSGFPPSDL
ncbi:MAG TPA: hypothetical protein VJT75_02280 [Thermoleophilaceae bacterium]|nr:hypothetical protein [Thermoleophilaceae bacterium]